MKYEHDVIRDLMPLCIDGIASEKSQEAVKMHLAECPDCRKEWEQMKANINSFEAPPLPVDTPKYAETAKRVRKHSVILKWFIAGAVILAAFGGLVIANLLNGAHFSAKGAAKAFAEDTVTDHALSPVEITGLGEIASQDDKTRINFFLAKSETGSVSYFANQAERSAPEQLGLWKCSSGFYSVLNEKQKTGIYMDIGRGNFQDRTEGFWYAAFLVWDENVKTITVQTETGTVEVHLNENRFGVFRRDDIPYQTGGERPDFRITEGEACDAAGNVLYTIQPQTQKIGDNEWTYYDWVAAE